MGQKDTPRQPSSLERLHQARKDKEVGIFRKTRSKTKGATAQKKQPEIKKKPTRVAEFEFDPAWVVPGGVIPYRQSGKSISMQEEIIRLMKSTPPQPNPFGDWRKPVDDAKLKNNDSSGFEKAKNPTESWAEKWARENQ